MTHSDFIFNTPFNNQLFSESEIKYKEFEECTFTDCDFSNCNFSGVVFTDCIFYNCNFKEAQINYVGLRNAVFNHCDFTDVNFAMTDQLLFEFHFNDCVLDYAKFYALKLKRMTFTNCSMIAVDFMATDLTEVLFDNCNLHQAIFTDATAEKADFLTSYNFTIDPEKTKLRKAQFSKEGLKGLLQKYEIIVR